MHRKLWLLTSLLFFLMSCSIYYFLQWNQCNSSASTNEYKKKRSLILNVSLWWPLMLNEDRSSMAKNYLLQMNPGKHSSWEIPPALLFSKPYAILPFLELHRTLKINIIIVVSMYFNIIFWCGLLMLYFGSSSTGDRGEWKLSSVVNVTFTDMNSSVWQDSGSGGLGHTWLFKSIWNCPNHCYNGCSRAEQKQLKIDSPRMELTSSASVSHLQVRHSRWRHWAKNVLNAFCDVFCTIRIQLRDWFFLFLFFIFFGLAIMKD